MAYVAAALAVGGSLYGAYSSNKSKNEALDAASAQNEAIAEQLGVVEGNIQGLLDEQSNPAELYSEIFKKYPELLASVLPSLTSQSLDLATGITANNISNFQLALESLYPDYKRLQSEQVKAIDSLNPANLGSEEILAQTRMLSPFIPAGTLDPSKGSVAGGTTNPTSLYRNLISGMYNDRRDQYMGALSGYLSNAENSSARQQSSAETFLRDFLSGASSSSQYVTGSTLTQEANNLNNQFGLLDTLLKIPTATVNTAAYDQATASSISQALSALGTAYQKSQMSTKPGS